MMVCRRHSMAGGVTREPVECGGTENENSREDLKYHLLINHTLDGTKKCHYGGHHSNYMEIHSSTQWAPSAPRLTS